MRQSTIRGALMKIAPFVVFSALSAQAQTISASGDADAGAELYLTECRGCHAVSIAPSLRGVIGRPAAKLESFPGYSEALRAKEGLVWTEENIDAFISNPQVFAPGSLMTKSITGAQQRADIIAYVASLPPPR